MSIPGADDLGVIRTAKLNYSGGEFQMITSDGIRRLPLVTLRKGRVRVGCISVSKRAAVELLRLLEKADPAANQRIIVQPEGGDFVQAVLKALARKTDREILG